MRNKQRFKTHWQRLWCACCVALLWLCCNAYAGFSIEGTQLLDANGKPFIMRGVNHGHAWFPQHLSAIEHIANAGANTVRVVLSSGAQWPRSSSDDVKKVISTCKRYHLICVLEVHDATGYGDKKSAVKIAEITAYWLSIKEVLQGQESYVLINIANEPFGNSAAQALWLKEHQTAIKALRQAGFEHTLIVDAPNWGQDYNEIMLAQAAQVAAADALSNTLFSVHMYQVYQDYSKIHRYVTRFLSEQKLPLIVGEFGASHQGEFVDANSILRIAKANNIGYLGWSWSGNGECCTDLDIVKNFNPNNLSEWGKLLIHSPDGIKHTAVKASVFGEE